MKEMAAKAALAFAVLLAFAGGAEAQRRNYEVRPLNFEIWCQETMSLPTARCFKREPADVEAFEAYSRQIQAYEIPHLQQKNRQAQIEANILHSDPVDRPATSVLQSQGAQGNPLTPPLPRTVP